MTSVQRILVPFDFSECSQAALDHACEFAERSKAELHMVHVIRKNLPNGVLADEIENSLEQLGMAIDAQQELALKTIKDVKIGDPATVIADYARKHRIDLITMGTRGRTGLAHLTLGSVAARVLRKATCPVLVVGPRKTDQQVSLAEAAETIQETFGEQLSGEKESGVTQFQELLKRELHVSETTSQQLIQELCQREWLQWEDGDPGIWKIVQGYELMEGSDFVRAPESPSQAVDLIVRARQLGATDIHIDPAEGNEILVRLRIDGKLEEYCRLDHRVAEHLINQYKTLGGLDIAEPFLPKEGRLRLPSELTELEVRITVAPVASGEAVALRLFARENIFLPLDNLGFSERVRQEVGEMLQRGEGLVLITGPTGAGKTTTVYSMLESLGGIDRNVVSIEDPVEFAVPFVRQMNVDERHGITMSSGLRTILRMDPDVVFVGEVRDGEAADIAMKAASSGKYVLTTLHTRDIASTITALRDMNIADRSLASNITGIINQRLVRRLCSDCKQAIPVDPQQVTRFHEAGLIAPQEIYHSVGCSSCRTTGFRGRIGIFEATAIREEFSNAVIQGSSEQELRDILQTNDVVALQANALHQVVCGTTSLEEALAVHWLS